MTPHMQIVCIIPVEAIMTADLWALVAAILLAVVQLTLSSVLTLHQLGGAWVAGPRDEPREVAGVSGRFVRAHRNLLEIFPQFVAALFLVHAAHAVGSLSAIGAWSSSPGCFMFPPTPSVLWGYGQSVGSPHRWGFS
jgi:uncharacterized MAPEG superfamily protein